MSTNIALHNVARIAILALLSVTAVWPASAQTFQDRWSPIPRANAAEKPPIEQDKIQERPQQQLVTPPRRLHSQVRERRHELPAHVTQQKTHSRGVLVGKASFYAYRSGKTANGMPYHRGELTAASRALPFGTRLRVTDVKTNKSVVVMVTDRGPASRGLILDLSLGAAQELGMASRGIIQVRAEIIS